MNVNDYEKFGVSGVVLTGAYAIVRWVVKRLDTSDAYNKERDKADSELIRLLSGVIEKNNITNELILVNQKELLNNQRVILMKLDQLRK